MRSRPMGGLIFATMGLLAWISVPLPAAAAPENVCSDANLPAPIQELLKKDFPSMRPRVLSDLGADDQKIWQTSHAKECPGIAVGHFESKDSLAFAVLLVAKSAPAGGYKFMVFTKGTSGDTYSWKLLNQIDGNIDSTGLTISKVPPGKFSNFQKTKSITTNLDNILLQWLDAGADLFYWSGGKYLRLNVIE
jgi:hypothetical protein